MNKNLLRMLMDNEQEEQRTQQQMNRIMRAVRDTTFGQMGEGYRPLKVTPVNQINVYLPPRIFR